MFCSTIIPTIARPTLSRAVHSVLGQKFSAADYEVIVVNDSGRPLPEAEWQQSDRVKILNTNQRERSVARNIGAATAKGKYLHFLDDDDWLLPKALDTFWRLAQRSEAGWLYGSTLLIDRMDTPLIRLVHDIQGNCFTQVMAGEWIPLQASCIRAEEFAAVGGFNPLITGPEDIDLLRRFALRQEIAGTGETVVCIGIGETNSSTDYARHSDHSRWAREQILNQPAVLSRLRASATNDYWRGRIVRLYLTSAVWNLTHRKPLMTASRTIFALANLWLSLPCFGSGAFWQAIIRRYESETFSRGIREVGHGYPIVEVGYRKIISDPPPGEARQ